MTSLATHHIVVSWRDLPRWDLKTARAATFRLAHPHFRPLGDFAEEATELVRPWDRPEAEWPVYGVNNEQGVVFSHRQRGDTFNAPYKRIRKDWFFHNPTRANVGSLGCVPDVPEDAITSPEYQVWRLRGELLPPFVEILLQTSYFREQIACHRVGAVKQRLFVHNLLDIPIPVMPLTTQRAILAKWRKVQTAITAAEECCRQIDVETNAGFLAELGLRAPTSGPAPRAFAVHWTDFLRWSVSYNQTALTGMDLTRGRYPVVPLGSILELVQYGTSEKANTHREGVPVLRISNIKDGELDITDLKHIPLPQKTLARLRLAAGDILIIRTSGSRGLVGTCAVFRESDPYVFASYLIRLRTSVERADPDFVAYFINSVIGRQQVDAISRQIMQNNINAQELRSLQLPLPPLAVQRQIMKKVAAARARIARERETARALSAQVAADMEAYLLGTKTVPKSQ